MISPRVAMIAIDASAPRRDAQLKRLRELSALGTQPLSQDVAPIDGFAKIVSRMIDTAPALIQQGDEAKERPA